MVAHIQFETCNSTWEIEINGLTNSITSNLKEVCPNCGIEDCYGDCSQTDSGPETQEEIDSRRGYNAAVDGIESLILALVSQGYNVLDKDFQTALECAERSISVNFSFKSLRGQKEERPWGSLHSQGRCHY